jgi:hypothetical protein
LRSDLIVANKSTGELALDIHYSGPSGDLPDTKARIKKVKEVVAQPEPPAEYCYPTVKSGPGESKVLGAHCARCPFKFDCYSGANNGTGLRSFAYSGGTKYFVHIDGKDPTVPELNEAGKRMKEPVDDTPTLLQKIN